MPVTDIKLVDRKERQRILTAIGYSSDTTVPARILSLVDEYAQNNHLITNPSYSYVIRDIEWVWGSRAIIEGLIVFRSEVVARLLEQCEKVAVFATTIGSHLEEVVSQMAEDGLVVQAAVLDAIGSDAAEKMADFVQDSISEIARAQGLTTSRRFSPGYCDWDVSQQKMVFQALKGDHAGINLTEGCLMIPRKSMSGIIGIGPPDSNVENYNPCKTCNKYDCLGRR